MNTILQWAVSSSILILVVLALRLLLKEKLSARWRYALWAVVLIRLLVPFQLPIPAPVTAAGLLAERPALAQPSIPLMSDSWSMEDIQAGGVPDVWTAADGTLDTANSAGTVKDTGDGHAVYALFWLSPGQVLFLLWGLGTAAVLLAVLVSNLVFFSRLRRSRREFPLQSVKLPIYITNCIPSPCLFGLFRPAVYLTPGTEEDGAARAHVLAHELTHYAHGDHIWSALRCLALALHWYNPLVWLAAALSKRDGELACDEGAIARLGEGQRIPYGRTLVDMVAQRAPRPGDLLSCSTAMTGGRKTIQQRIALLVKKPQTVKTALFAAISVLALAAVFVFAGASPSIGRYDRLGTVLDQVEALEYQPNYVLPSGQNKMAVLTGDELRQLKELLCTGEELVGDASYSLYSNAPERLLLFLNPPDSYSIAATDYDQLRYAAPSGQALYLAELEDGCHLAECRSDGSHELALLPKGTVSQVTALLQRSAGTFQQQVEQAQSIQISQPLISSRLSPGPITDPQLLQQAKALLADAVPVYTLEDGELAQLAQLINTEPEAISTSELMKATMETGRPLALLPSLEGSVVEWPASYYYLISWHSRCLVVWMDWEQEGNSPEVIALLPDGTIGQLEQLAAQQGKISFSANASYSSYRGYVEQAQAIQYTPPDYSSTLYPSPITDSELLEEAVAILYHARDWTNGQESLDLSRASTDSSRITLFGPNGEQYPYLLFPQDGHVFVLAYWEGAASSYPVVAVMAPDELDALAGVARRQEELSSGCQDFLSRVEQAQAIQYSPPPISSQAYPGPIVDGGLLEEVKALLETAQPTSAAAEALEQNMVAGSSATVTLIGGTFSDQSSYLLYRQDGTTYVVDPTGPGSYAPIAELDISPDALAGVARRQWEKNQLCRLPLAPALETSHGDAYREVLYAASIYHSYADKISDSDTIGRIYDLIFGEAVNGYLPTAYRPLEISQAITLDFSGAGDTAGLSLLIQAGTSYDLVAPYPEEEDWTEQTFLAPAYRLPAGAVEQIIQAVEAWRAGQPGSAMAPAD